MALPATTVWEIQTDGSDNNGGGFDSAGSGTDYTQGAGQQVISWLSSGGTYTNDLSITNATPSVVSSASRNFVAADVGNVIHLTAGTNVTAGWYHIVSVGSNQATLDRNAMSGAGSADGSGYLGGALKSLGGLGVIFQTATQSVAGMKAYVENGTYTLDTATPNTAATTGHGGPIDLDASQMDSKGFYIKGYDPAQGRDSFAGTRPIIDCGSQVCTSVIELKGSSAVSSQHVLAYIEIDGNDTNTTYGVVGNSQNYDRMVSCVIHNINGQYAVYICGAVNTYIYSCAAIGAYIMPGYGNRITDCERGFYYCAPSVNCIADNNSGDGFDNCAILVNCLSYNNTGDGYQDPNSSNIIVNCISYGNGAFEFKTASAYTALINCASGKVTSGRTDATVLIDLNDPGTLSNTVGDVFTNAATGDFSITNTAGGGALLRAAGISPYGQTGYLDIGAVQHADHTPAEIAAAMWSNITSPNRTLQQ